MILNDKQLAVEHLHVEKVQGGKSLFASSWPFSVVMKQITRG